LFSGSAALLHLHSFPTRRSSDLFIGVTTGQSSIMRVFPVWARLLGLDAELTGVDLPLDAAPDVYRRALVRLRDDPSCAGALVTRSEEHTSELQSRENLVCRLLLE